MRVITKFNIRNYLNYYKIKLLKLTNLAIEDKYNSILIIIDKLIKYSHIIACIKKFIIEQLKYIVLN